MDRFYIRTDYHYWQIMDRETFESVTSFSARGQGDAMARSKARAYLLGLNDAYYGREVKRELGSFQQVIEFRRGREIGQGFRRESIALLAEEQCG